MCSKLEEYWTRKRRDALQKEGDPASLSARLRAWSVGGPSREEADAALDEMVEGCREARRIRDEAARELEAAQAEVLGPSGAPGTRPSGRPRSRRRSRARSPGGQGPGRFPPPRANSTGICIISPTFPPSQNSRFQAGSSSRGRIELLRPYACITAIPANLIPPESRPEDGSDPRGGPAPRGDAGSRRFGGFCLRILLLTKLPVHPVASPALPGSPRPTLDPSQHPMQLSISSSLSPTSGTKPVVPWVQPRSGSTPLL